MKKYFKEFNVGESEMEAETREAMLTRSEKGRRAESLRKNLEEFLIVFHSTNVAWDSIHLVAITNIAFLFKGLLEGEKARPWHLQQSF